MVLIDIQCYLYLVSGHAKGSSSYQTGYGISDPVYGNKIVVLAGCGQGNGLGPSLWALIITVILTMCKKAGHGMKFLTSITKVLISFMGYLFVDETNII